MAPRMTGLVVLLFFVWLCPLSPLSVDASAMDYAVQVAAYYRLHLILFTTVETKANILPSKSTML